MLAMFSQGVREPFVPALVEQFLHCWGKLAYQKLRNYLMMISTNKDDVTRKLVDMTCPVLDHMADRRGENIDQF